MSLAGKNIALMLEWVFGDVHRAGDDKTVYRPRSTIAFSMEWLLDEVIGGYWVKKSRDFT